MECRIDGATLHYVEHGRGLPIVALHGVGVDHREIEAAVEAVVPDAGCRRVYPDLPGMGRSTAQGLASNDDVVACLTAFIDRCVGGPVLVVGHSYGAYLARGIAARRPDLVLGLALWCPIGARSSRVPEHVVVREDPDAHDELEPGEREGFDEYFVVRTLATQWTVCPALPVTRMIRASTASSAMRLAVQEETSSPGTAIYPRWTREIFWRFSTLVPMAWFWLRTTTRVRGQRRCW